MAQTVKNRLQCGRPGFSSWVGKEEGMATRSSTLAWRIPWIAKPGELQSMGLHTVRCDWAQQSRARGTGLLSASRRLRGLFKGFCWFLPVFNETENEVKHYFLQWALEYSLSRFLPQHSPLAVLSYSQIHYSLRQPGPFLDAVQSNLQALICFSLNTQAYILGWPKSSSWCFCKMWWNIINYSSTLAYSFIISLE